ncbi:MAG: enoyl-CoA hydratase/carnithine racemase [Firmicutes bacterium]|nr:enoyl-CoA hydratase/carnithine racemase [Bacillota bacterium]
MEYQNLIYAQENGVAVITLNRPKAYNALCAEVLAELDQVMTILENSAEVRVVIITGGSKVFAAGADVTELMNADTMAAYRNCSNAHRVYDRFEALPFPTIAAVNGAALGGGCELTLCCDFRIAGENSMFGLPEITLGILPGAGGTQRLTKLVGPARAKEMVLLGSPVKGEKIAEFGLATKVVADDQVMPEAKKLAVKLLERPGVALALAKETVNYAVNVDVNTGKSYERARFAMAFSSADQKEGMKAFVEKRKPVYINK